MFGAFRRLAVLGGIAAAVRSPQGQQAIAKAKQLAADPANRQKAAELLKKFTDRGNSAPRTGRTT